VRNTGKCGVRITLRVLLIAGVHRPCRKRLTALPRSGVMAASGGRGMGKYRTAALGVAAFGLVVVGMGGTAGAAPKTTAVQKGSAVSDISSQTRTRRPRTRITVYPRNYMFPPGIGPRNFGVSEFPRPYPYDWPGPNAKRECVGWLASEARPSGPVVVPRRRCWWVSG